MVGVEAAARSAIIVLPLLWLGCGAEPTTTVALSQHVDHLMWVVDDEQRELLLDTGAPTTILKPAVAGTAGAALVPAWRDPAGFNDGTTTVLASEKLPAIELKNGLIGMDLLRKRRFTWDHPGARLIFGDPSALLPAELETRSIPLEMAGTGRSCVLEGACSDHRGARALVEARLDGVPVTLMLDSGTRELTVFRDTLAALPAKERPTRQVTDRRRATLTLSRLEQVEIGPLSLNDVLIQVFDVDAGTARLRVEVGRKVDGFIGAGLLFQLYPTFDFEAGLLELRAVDGQKNVASRMRGIGLGGMVEGDCLRVTNLALGLTPDRLGVKLDDCFIEFGGYRAEIPGAERAFFGQLPSLPVGTQIPMTRRTESGTEVLLIPVELFLPEPKEPQIHLSAR